MARIFISSTTEDLGEHRKAVIRALQEAGHELALIHHSDAVVAIVGLRYGVTAEGDNPDGLSYTELEVLEASRIGKPILVFMGSVGNAPSLEAEKLGRYQPFRKAVINNLRVQAFTSPDDLAQRVVRAVTAMLLEPRDVTQTATSASPSLPPTIDPFELAWRLVVDRQAQYSLLRHMDVSQLMDAVRKRTERAPDEPGVLEEVLRTLRSTQTGLAPDPLWLAWMRATSPLVSTSTPTPPPHAA